MQPQKPPSRKRNVVRRTPGNAAFTSPTGTRPNVASALSSPARSQNASSVCAVNSGWSAVVISTGGVKPSVLMASAALALGVRSPRISSTGVPSAAGTAKSPATASSRPQITMRSTRRLARSVCTTRASIATPPIGAKALCATPVAAASGSAVPRLPAMTSAVKRVGVAAVVLRGATSRTSDRSCTCGLRGDASTARARSCPRAPSPSRCSACRSQRPTGESPR